jgi:hypothetical protein
MERSDRRGEREAQMTDTRNLPEGTWKLRRTPVLRKAGLSRFKVEAFDAATQDLVCADIVIGSKNISLADMELPDELPGNLGPEKVWYLSNIKPRTALAKGGTAEMLRRLAQQADANGCWIWTEVQPKDVSPETLIQILEKYGGFIRGKEHAFVMHRPPKVGDVGRRDPKNPPKNPKIQNSGI